MKEVLHESLFKVIVVLLLLTSVAALCAQNILVLNTYNPTYPWTAYFNLGLRQMAEESGQIELFEDLDVTRFGSKRSGKLCPLFIVKICRLPLDAVIGNSDRACTFIETYCSFPVYSQSLLYVQTEYSGQNILCLDVKYNEVINETWRLIQELQPKLTSIFIIAGDPSMTETVYNELVKIAPSNCTVELFIDFTFEELKKTMSSLPKTTAAFFIPVTQDRTGTQIIPRQLLTELAQTSTAPIYTLWETLIGTGCVGGEMLSAQKTAQELIRGLHSYLKNGKFDDVYSISQPVIDWEAAKKFSLIKEAVPASARVVNKPDPFYIVHAKTILVIANIVLAVFFIILLTGIYYCKSLP